MSLQIAEISLKAQEVLRCCDATMCLVIFDYLQRASRMQGYTDARSNVDALVDKLVDLAHQLKCPVLAISSQNRTAAYDKGGSSDLTTLKESSAIEYACDAALFLTASRDQVVSSVIAPASAARPIDLTVSKQRHGPIGAVRLIFRPDIGDFREEARAGTSREAARRQD